MKLRTLLLFYLKACFETVSRNGRHINVGKVNRFSIQLNGGDFNRADQTRSNFGQIEKSLRQAIRQNNMIEAEKIIRNWDTDVCQSSTRTALFVIVETCHQNSKTDNILHLITKLPPGHLKLSSEDDVMPFLSKTKDFRTAQSLLEYLIDRNVKLSARSISMLLKAITFQTPQSEEITDPTPIFTILGMCINWSIKPDIVLLNGIIDTFIRFRQLTSALSLFQSISIGIDVPLPVELMGKTMLGWDTVDQSAREVLEAFEDSVSTLKLQPNVRTVNTVMKGLREVPTEGLELCLKLWQWMIKCKLTPDSITLNTVISAAINNGRLSIAEELLFRDMKGGAVAGVEAYTELIQAFAITSDSASAERVYSLMISRGQQPNDLTLNVYMAALISGGRLVAAKSLVQQAKEAVIRSEGLDGISRMKSLLCSYVVSLCKQCHDPHSALYWAEEGTSRDCRDLLCLAEWGLLQLDELQILPDIMTLNSYLQAVCESERPSRVTDILKIIWSMNYLGVYPNEYSYSIAFSALAKNGYADLAKTLYHLVDVKYFDVTTINSLFRAFASSSNPLGAVELYFELFTQQQFNSTVKNSLKPQVGLKPTKVTYTVLYLALANSVRTNSQSKRSAAQQSDTANEDLDDIGLVFSNESGRFYEKGSVLANRNNRASKLNSAANLPLINRISENELVQDRDWYQLIQEAAKFDAGFISQPQPKPFHNSGIGIDDMLRRLYRHMRFDNLVQPDDIMVSVLSALFAVNLQSSRPGLTRDTAVMIFEDLVVTGYNPSKLIPMIRSCGYPAHITKDLMRDDLSETVRRLRLAPTSTRIFQKYQWNEFRSTGLNPFF